MKRMHFCTGIGLLLIVISAYPIFVLLRENIIDHNVTNRYDIHYAYQDKQGYEPAIDTQNINIFNHHIRIIEAKTGKHAPLTSWDKDENVPAGEIVNIQYQLDGRDLSSPSEVWLSNRERGGRYFSWLEILTVKDRKTDQNLVYIVQRITDDQISLEKSKWKIIRIHQDGTVKEKLLSYSDRSKDPLSVKLLNFSYVGGNSMGYHSDMYEVIPNVIFPLLYPLITFAVGCAIMIGILIFVIVQKIKGVRKSI
ncbi:hypothetical protein [Bacillus halotolerans]|uniref:Uncharacterized protein n=1 Tax=Bacillus halotolerans TaxID=260554 RepID=A0A9Q6F2J0_9BACI|nr:hypothetical protein [Bacillus halotolerans]PLS08106.1 hypothetical protein CUU63_07830 [Bacillus halotolerans]